MLFRLVLDEQQKIALMAFCFGGVLLAGYIAMLEY